MNKKDKAIKFWVFRITPIAIMVGYIIAYFQITDTFLQGFCILPLIIVVLFSAFLWWLGNEMNKM